MSIKKYVLDGARLDWFRNNYAKLGGKGCVEHLNLPLYFLKKIAGKLGIKVRKETTSKLRSQNAIAYFSKKRDNIIEEAKKIVVDSPEKAYTLGFLWGDGYLRHQYKCYYATFDIEKKDFDAIIDVFRCWGKWCIYYRKAKDRRKEQGNACLCDSAFGWFLKIHDYEYKSSVAPSKILLAIPFNLRSYWWRGYIDADGCFYIYLKNYVFQFSIAGSFEQKWNEVESLCSRLGISKHKICRRIHKNQRDKDSIVRLTNQKDIVTFGEYIYGGNNDFEMGLKRKHKKYLLIKSYVSRKTKSHNG